MSSTPTSPINGNVPITYPLTLIKTLEFKVENIEDHHYLTSQEQEDDFIADMKFAASDVMQVKLVSIDGIKVE